MDDQPPIRLLQREPSEVLAAAWLQEYEKRMELIHSQLVRLNGQLFVLGRIANFNWHLFVPRRPDQHFWALTSSSLYDSSVTAIYRLCVDTGSDVITVRKLRNGIASNILPQFRDEFTRLLKETEFDARCHDLEEKVKLLRNNYIGHMNAQKNTSPTDEDIDGRSLGVQEMLEYAQRLRKFFEVLCLGHGRMDMPLGYWPDRRSPIDLDPRPDIDRMLDEIAARSDAMNLYREKGIAPFVMDAWLPTHVMALLEYDERLKKYSRWLGQASNPYRVVDSAFRIIADGKIWEPIDPADRPADD
jgi:hypothetical protein